jgi:hypothetical protein
MKGNDESTGPSAGRNALVGWPAWPRGTSALIAAAVVPVVAVVVALGLSACGGGAANNQGVAALPSTTSQPGTSGGGPSSSQVAGAGSTSSASTVAGGAATTLPSAASTQEQALEFAECMRSHGIADFPDPNSGGGFIFNANPGIMHGPHFQAAQNACQKYMPPGPGSGPPPSAQAMAQMLKVSQCMRRHGISGFPDPRTSAPPHALSPQGVGVISDIDGVILVFPSTIDEQSPAFMAAAAACRFPLHNH